MIAISLGLVSALCWAAHDCVARLYAVRISPYRLAFWVTLAGAMLLLPAVLWRGTIWQGSAPGFAMAAALGAVYAVALGGLFKALSLAPVSIVGPMTAGYPALVVVWGLLNGLAPVPLEWTGLVLVLAGAAIVGVAGKRAPGGARASRRHVVLALTAIIAANAGFAAAVILGQAAAVSLGEAETTFVSRFPAAVLLLPLLLRDMAASSASAPGPRIGARLGFGTGRAAIAILVMAGLDVTAVTAINGAGHFANKEFAAMGVSAYGALAVILAMIFLKERTTPGQWLGIALVVTGIFCLGWPRN